MTKKILAISLLSAVLTPVVLTWAVDMMTILAFTGRSTVISGGLFGDDTIECWYYIGDVLRNPSESFTRFVLSELDLFTGGKKLTTKLVEKFVPTIRHAIQTTLLDMATRSIREQSEPPTAASTPAVVPIAPTATPAAPPKDAAAASPPGIKAPNSAIVTTAEELEAFEIIRELCADSPLAAGAPVQYRDTVGYFAVNTGSVRKSFVRLYLSARRKSITTKVALARASLLAHGFEVEAFQDGSRVYISGPKDLLRPRPLLLMAYEEEIKRKDADDAEPALPCTRRPSLASARRSITKLSCDISGA